MGKIFLIARREYLAYVTAWGFWLGMIFTPLILLLAGGLPILIEQTQPVRYYTIIDETGDFRAAFQAEMDERRERAALELIRATQGKNADAVKSFEALRDGGTDLKTAMEAVSPGMSMTIPNQPYRYVPPPAGSIEEIAPYLTGERSVTAEDGSRTLYAAFIVFEDRIEYWSEDVVNPELAQWGERVSRDLARQSVFHAAGIDEAVLDKAIEEARPVKSLSPSVADTAGEISFADRAPFVLSWGLSFLLWLLIFSVVNYLLTGTIEERSNKIFDTLLTSISLPQLLTGKLLGVLGLSLTLIGVWSSASGVMMLTAASNIPPDVAEGLRAALGPRLLVPTLMSFVIGYLMYGALFLALGSLCDSIQEAQALLSPIFIVMMIPLLMIPVSISSPDSGLLNTLSWVPLLTPFLLIMRIPNDMPLWLISAQILWMAGFTLLVIWVGTRVYRAGAVHGAGLSEARSWVMGLFGRKAKA